MSAPPSQKTRTIPPKISLIIESSLDLAMKVGSNWNIEVLSLHAFGRFADRIAHRGVGLQVLELVVVKDAQVAATEGVGHGFGDVGFGQHDQRAVFGLLGDVFLLL